MQSKAMIKYLIVESQTSSLLKETFNGEVVKKAHDPNSNFQMQFYFSTSNQANLEALSSTNPSSEPLIRSELQPRATPNPILERLSNLENSNQAVSEALRLFNFMNTKLKKTTKQEQDIYNLLVAIDSSNSKSSQPNEIFPVLISISETSISLEFFICENKRPFEVKSESCRNELMKVIQNLNEKLLHCKYEIKTEKNCIVLKDTINTTHTFKEFIMVEFIKRFCFDVKTFTDTSRYLYQVLKTETSNEEYKSYKVLSKLDRFYINSQPSNLYSLYPFLFKRVRFCEIHFEVELNLVKIFQEIVGKCWIVIDKENHFIYYPVYENIRNLDECNLDLKEKLEVLQFLEQLKSKNLHILNKNLNLGVLSEGGINMFMPKVPLLEFLKEEVQSGDQDGLDVVEENLIEIIFEAHYGFKGIKNLNQIIECVDFERKTAKVIDDEVKLVEISRDTDFESGVFVYGYYKTQNKLFLVVG